LGKVSHYDRGKLEWIREANPIKIHGFSQENTQNDTYNSLKKTKLLKE
jgi:hypothetical protein